MDDVLELDDELELCTSTVCVTDPEVCELCWAVPDAIDGGPETTLVVLEDEVLLRTRVSEKG